ncbi:MAG: WD40/YVTN/BNR-like repeat-containing protein [Ktedonobacteraceae bacterium]
MTTLFIAFEKALAIADQRNGGWKVDFHVVDSQPQCLAIDLQHPQHVYCGTFDQGLWHSADAGMTWQQTGAGITSEKITSVAVSAQEQANGTGVVYAGTEPSAIFRSENQGQSWQELTALLALPSASTWSFPPRPWTSHVRWITPDPLVAGSLFAAIEAGALVHSRDGGQTWEDRKPDGPFDTHTLVHPRLAHNRVYSAAGDGFMQPGHGFVQSNDGGETWFRSGDGLAYHYLWSVAADPADPETLVISAAPGPQQAHNPHTAESAIYRRSGDSPWQMVHDGLPPAQGLLTSVLAANEAEPGVFYAANNQGVFRSADTGLHWETLPIPWPANSHFGRAHALVAGPGR